MPRIPRNGACRRITACGLLALAGTATANTDVILELGMGYDSNPHYLPAAERDTAVWSIHPQILYRSWHAPDMEWFAQAGYQANDSELDPQTIRLPSDPASPLTAEPPNNRLGWSAVGIEKYLADDKAFSITVNAVDHRHDNDDFNYRVGGITPELRVMIGDASRLYWTLGWQRIMYTNRNTVTSAGETQTDTESSMEMGWWRRLSPFHAADLSLRYTHVDSNEPAIDSRSIGTDLRTIHMLDEAKRLTIMLGFESERFDLPVSSFTRTDRLAEFSLGLEIRHTDSVSYTVTGTYSDHDSTLPDASYKRTVTRFNTSVTF